MKYASVKDHLAAIGTDEYKRIKARVDAAVDPKKPLADLDTDEMNDAMAEQAAYRRRHRLE
jgi:hypothetical protein